MATNRIPPDDPQRAAPAQRGMQQRQPARPVQTPGTAPMSTAAAPVGTAARPSPNPISPVRPAMNPPPQQQAPAAQGPYSPVRLAQPPGVDFSDVRSYIGSQWPQYNPNNAGTMAPRPAYVPMRYPPNERAAQPAPPLPTPRPSTPQTEASNPLTGPQSPQEEDTTDSLNPGAAMGFNRRGSRVPAGTDSANFSANVGGSGGLARSFRSPGAAGAYDTYVRRLFDDPRDLG